jgi:hypothetical protein
VPSRPQGFATTNPQSSPTHRPKRIVADKELALQIQQDLQKSPLGSQAGGRTGGRNAHNPFENTYHIETFKVESNDQQAQKAVV